MILQITQFTLLINKIDKTFVFWIKDKEWKELNFPTPNSTYLIGHITNKTYGEFISIDIIDNEFKIHNDVFGSIPVFIYETDYHFGITNSLVKINQITQLKTDIEERQFYEYFIFGFQTYDSQTYYKYIKAIQTQFKFSYSLLNNNISIKIIKESFLQNYFTKNINENKDISEILISETKEGLASLNGSTAILLSGGKDSLLGGLLVKSIYPDDKLATATFGLQNTQDIVLAKTRSFDILNSIHHEYLIDELKITKDDFINHALAQNGFGTLSSIYYSFFIKHLVKVGFKNAIFSDHFECTRKDIPDIAYLKERYTTPRIVVERYIRNKIVYNEYLNDAIENIQHNYGKNACYKFYYHDRNQRGQAWKMVLCNEYGMVKYNLSNHFQFLKENYYDVNYKSKFNYNHLLGTFSKICGPKKHKLENQNANLNNIPINPQKLIYDHSEFFIDTLSNNVSLSLNTHFNLENIIHDVKNRTIIVNGEWLILRLLNLTIFNTYLNTK
jgi:hypothetical protein